MCIYGHFGLNDSILFSFWVWMIKYFFFLFCQISKMAFCFFSFVVLFISSSSHYFQSSLRDNFNIKVYHLFSHGATRYQHDSGWELIECVKSFFSVGSVQVYPWGALLGFSPCLGLPRKDLFSFRLILLHFLWWFLRRRHESSRRGPSGCCPSKKRRRW